MGQQELTTWYRWWVVTTHPAITAVPGTPNLLLGGYDLATVGYQAKEFFVSGTATSYSQDGDWQDGDWNANPSGEAEYTTRFVVLTPTDDAAFNGTVIVEWLNVSGGIDAPAVWMMAHREVVRAGYAYVCVSTQRVGIEGGGDNITGFDMSLKTQDLQRYSSLSHPGDDFAYDIFTQAGRLARDGGNNGLLGALNPEYVLAVGESQSAIFLTTYVNLVDPIAKVYDGILVHSRFGPAAPLDGNSVLDLEGVKALTAVPFRPDPRVPVITILTETDLLDGVLPGYVTARIEDNERFRAWEIPGAAHADTYTIKLGFTDSGSLPLDQLAEGFAPTRELMGQQLAYSINFAPQHHYVVQAAIAGLHDWVRTGEAASAAAPITLTEADPRGFVLDANGVAEGGVRTPWVDVPIARTSGLADGDNPLTVLFGSGEMLDGQTLARLYPGGSADYVARFTEALDRAIEAGFIIAADREEIIALAAVAFRGIPDSE
ncbi:MAG: hypothetical protein QOH60_2228 [Mycobacterium sp.]|nr:hypothetical protein [Mycobacterium sp.]